MNGSYFARVTSSRATNEVHMTGAWSAMDSTEHLIFWRLKPISPDHGSVLIELFDKTANTLLATHSVSPLNTICSEPEGSVPVT